MRLGVKTMRQSALTKLKEGVTSFEEVLRSTVGDD
jgi:type IV pilus assembly protein PilB